MLLIPGKTVKKAAQEQVIIVDIQYSMQIYYVVEYECNEGFLFNVDGVCINTTAASLIIPQQKNQILKYMLDSVLSETRQRVAPVCQEGKEELHMKGCKCSDEPVVKGLDGNPRGGCIPPLV